MLKGLFEEEGEGEQEEQEQEQGEKMEAHSLKYSGTTNVSINNHLKCKWLKCSNKKT